VPDARRQGVGEALCQAFLAWCREKGCERVFVQAYTSNDVGMNFYKKMGFTEYVSELEMPL
jgi:GNAT superfamily N-acetyltransferase